MEKQTIIFEAYNGRNYSCSPRAIYEYMLQDPRFKKFRFIWCSMYPEHYTFLLDEPRTEIVMAESPEYFRAYARAKYWVTNSRIPYEVTKSENQVMLQTWHGSPLKRLRGDIAEHAQVLNSHNESIRKNLLDTQRYDYFIVPSPRTKQYFVSAFALPIEKKPHMILETGYPRNDYLSTYTEADVAEVRRKLKLPANKKVILYAPTWRDDQYNGDLDFFYEPPIDFVKLRQELGDEYVVLFRAHYYIADNYDFSQHKGFVYNVSSVDDVNELYIVSDVLVTDYSSVLFDYANLQRPMIFYMYDKEHYEKELRGFYFPPEELPGDIVTTQDEVTALLMNLDEYAKETRVKLNAFHEIYNALDDGYATERVINAVWGKELN
jgi:CDP-glycerol glycerophosphotransferase